MILRDHLKPNIPFEQPKTTSISLSLCQNGEFYWNVGIGAEILMTQKLPILFIFFLHYEYLSQLVSATTFTAFLNSIVLEQDVPEQALASSHTISLSVPPVAMPLGSCSYM